MRDSEHAPSSEPFEGASCLDRYVEGGYVAPDRDSDPATARLADLLALIDLPISDDAASSRAAILVNLTAARALRGDAASSPDVAGRIITDAPAGSLLPEDAQALDALIGAGWHAATAAPNERARSASELLAMLSLPPPAPGELAHDRGSLIEATLQRVQQSIEAASLRLRLPAEELAPQPSKRGLRIADLLSIAAMIVIGTAIFWPMLTGLREASRSDVCEDHLHRAALGFTLFAGDHDSELPMLKDLRDEHLGRDGTWWNVGEPGRSHSANLFTLVRFGYASMDDLSCPGNCFAPAAPARADAADWSGPEEVSFSYQLFDRRPPRWGSGSHVVVLTDRSPIIDRARRGERFDPHANSRNHLGQGQNVLFNDGGVFFFTTPVADSGDNMWLPATMAGEPFPRLSGREKPADPTDAFVGP